MAWLFYQQRGGALVKQPTHTPLTRTYPPPPRSKLNSDELFIKIKEIYEKVAGKIGV